MPTLVIASNPATFTVPPSGSFDVTFAIPANIVSISAAVWDATQDDPGNPTASVGGVGVTLAPNGGSFKFQLSASAGQITTILAATGTNLAATFGDATIIDIHVTVFTLTLTYTVSGGGSTSQGDVIHYAPHFSDSANAQRSIVRHG